MLLQTGYPVAFLSVLVAIAALVYQGWAYRARGRRVAELAHDLQESQRIAQIGTVRWDFQRDIVEWTDEYARLLGLEPGGRMTGAEFQGMLLPEYEERVVASEERALKTSAQTGEPARREIVYKVQSRDGRIMDIAALSELMADREGRPVYMISTVRDVTDELRQQAELRESERNLSAALRVADLSWYREDLHDGSISWSHGLYDLLGRDPAKGPVKLEEIITADDQEPFRKKLEAVTSASPDAGNNHKNIELRLRRCNGDELIAKIVLETTFDTEDRPVVLYIVIRDISDDVSKEKELRDAVAAAEHANASKSEFLAMISHELRTPMNGVLGMLGALEETELDEAQRDQLKIARSSAHSLLVILNDILDASKIEAGRMQIEEETFELQPMIRSVIHLYAQRAIEKGVLLDSRIDKDIPAWVRADSGRIRQVLANLVSNAIKFTEKGSVILAVTCQPPRGDETLRLRFCVSDTGTGIASEYHSRVFRRFEQLGASYNNRMVGTGLGLSISQSLAELMHGEMGFESALGQGSSFWLELPLSPSEPHARTPFSPEDAALPRMRILVADDNSTNQLVARSMLERLDQNVDLVVNGAEAVGALEKHDYDMILMDVSMPVMDGPTATRTIRELGGDAGRIPIIALTAHAGNDQHQFYLDAGFDEVLTKPIMLPQLAEVLSRWKSYAEERDAAETAEPVTASQTQTAPEAPSVAEELPAPVPATPVEETAAPAPAATPKGGFVDSEALHRKLAEMEEEFGADTLASILSATRSDLGRHLATLERETTVAAEEQDDVILNRAFHSLVGISATLGCDKLTNHCKLLESLPNARQDAAELVNALKEQVRLMHAEIGELIQSFASENCA